MKNDAGETLFLYALESNNYELVKYIITENIIDFNIKDAKGNSPNL